MEKGTLYQLKTAINRTSVPNDPSDNMKAAEDFLLVVLHAHITAASQAILSFSNISSVSALANSIVASYVMLDRSSPRHACSDEVFVYACDVLSLGLLWMGFHDAIREGDGDRVMLYWKFLLPIFRTSGRRNYCIEALNIQLHRRFTLSQRQAAQLVWSRFINTRGRKGCNIPCDLHLEHLNRRLKAAIGSLGSNIQPKSLLRAAKSIGVVHRVCEAFENETRHRTDSDKHTYPRFTKRL